MKVLAKVISGAITAALCGLAVPASAQLESRVPTGSRFAKDPDQIKQDLVRLMQKKFARCVWRRDSENALAWLEHSDIGTVDVENLPYKMDDLNRSLSLSPCLIEAMRGNQAGVQFRFQPTLLRALLAEEAYLAKHDGPIPIAEAEPELLASRVYVDRAPTTLTTSAFVDCVVYHSPAAADAMLRTDPASAREDEAVRSLIPAVSNCVTDGQQLSITNASLRSFVAEGLWGRTRYGGAAAAGAGVE